ncbi:MAG TPA: hypothetical protein VHY37_00625 [Tepidisphaeraceae bacterium]|jgi:hypothetical protein|nr:hypothetical protein [Tepidisphaeraceae bacterium]
MPYRNVMLLVAACGGLCAVSQAWAQSVQTPIDPDAYAAIGSISGQGTYSFNTGSGSTTPSLTVTPTGGVASTVYGVIDNGVAVFDFNSVDLPSGSTTSVMGSLPIAILSRSSVSLSSAFNVGE